MILLFDNNMSNLSWCKAENSHFHSDSCEFSSSCCDSIIKDVDNAGKIEAVGYFLRHSVELFEKQTVLLTGQLFNNLRHNTSFFPEYSDTTFQIIDYWMGKMPKASHVLISDTAFFNKLPSEAGNYAVPYDLSKKGIRRYGSCGLFHSWAVESVWAYTKLPLSKIISVYIGDHTNVAAVKDGLAVETSTGFTPVEGILSSTGCGDIDPTIVFYLQSIGMTFGQITHLLSSQSGFAALMNKQASLADIINGGADAQKALDIYLYQVKRYIGSFISVLGSVDAVIFLAEKPDLYGPIISQICQGLAFLGLRYKTIDRKDFLQDLTDNASLIKVFSLSCNKWEIMTHNIKRLLDKEK
jgi:acetate kinase